MLRGQLHMLSDDLAFRWAELDETFERWRAVWSGDVQPADVTNTQTVMTTATMTASAQSSPASVGGGRSG